jgi:hypothetical protein
MSRLENVGNKRLSVLRRFQGDGLGDSVVSSEQRWSCGGIEWWAWEGE